MLFRLGYVAMTLNLEDCSPSGTVTVLNLNKIPDENARLYKLRQVSKKNLQNQMRIFKYNKAMDIRVYRLTSKLIPLATHPMTADWDYQEEFKEEFKELGSYIRENNFRISAHPDHFTLLNSNNPKVYEDSIRDLDYHIGLLEAMGLVSSDYKLVIHVGGLYKDKQASMERFRNNFIKLPKRIQDRLMLENDDKSYTAGDVLGICQDLKIPMVLDVHHHQCVNNGETLEEILPMVFETWRNERLPPKLHFSSPKSPKDFRSHADNIDSDAFRAFLDIARKTGTDFDVMLEAKNKDSALIKLSSELEKYEDLERINLSTFKMI